MDAREIITELLNRDLEFSLRQYRDKDNSLLISITSRIHAMEIMKLFPKHFSLEMQAGMKFAKGEWIKEN